MRTSSNGWKHPPQLSVPRLPTPMAAKLTRLLGALCPKIDRDTIVGIASPPRAVQVRFNASRRDKSVDCIAGLLLYLSSWFTVAHSSRNGSGRATCGRRQLGLAERGRTLRSSVAFNGRRGAFAQSRNCRSRRLLWTAASPRASTSPPVFASDSTARRGTIEANVWLGPPARSEPAARTRSRYLGSQLPVVRWAVRPYLNLYRGQLEDAEQTGIMGLINSARHYDRSRGFHF